MTQEQLRKDIDLPSHGLAESPVARLTVPTSPNGKVDQKRVYNTDLDMHQHKVGTQYAFKNLLILGTPHVTTNIAVRCVLHQSPVQGIHRCKLTDLFSSG